MLATAPEQQRIQRWYESPTPNQIHYLNKCQVHSASASKGYKITLTDWRKNRFSRPKHFWYCIVAKPHRPVVQITGHAIVETIQNRFRALADEWSVNTMHISSASDLINDKRYQEIIGLGWDVVPYLLTDLQQNKRFWFPALAAITGVRPFDPSEINNPRRMTEAWVKWGKWKGLI